MDCDTIVCYNNNMKVWIRYLIGIIFGVVAALILPWNNATGSSIITFITELCIQFGRYLVVPLVFCTAIVSVNKLRISNIVGKTALWTFAIIIVTSFLLTLLGLVSVGIVKLPRIPPTGIEEAADISAINIGNMLKALFPASAFASLANGGYLLVCFFFAMLIGWFCYSDQNTFKPVYTLADSLSHLFFKISSFFSEVLCILVIALMCYWTIQFKGTLQKGIFGPMIALFTVDFLIIIGVIYPLAIRYLCREQHPYKIIYASLAPMFMGFISGDANFTLPVLIRHGKDSLGIRRRSGGSVLPIFSIFARGGSSLVATISFVIIWRSYSSLSLPFQDIISIFFLSFALSFFLGNVPSGGAFILLTILCQKFGKGFETSYNLLAPALVVISSFSTLIDTATAMVGTYIVADKTNMAEHRQVFRFI